MFVLDYKNSGVNMTQKAKHHQVGILLSMLLAAVSLYSQAVFSQSAAFDDSWPSRPISMIIPFPPGGVATVVGRPISEGMSKNLEKPIIMENKPGAGGGIGNAYVAKAKPDGYNVLFAMSSVSTIPETDRIAGKSASYTTNQLRPIGRITSDPVVIVVRGDAPWKTMREFIADAKKNPGKFNFSSSGNYGTMQLPMEMLKTNQNIFVVHIPYGGAGPAVLAVLSGEVDIVASGPSTVVQNVKAGKLRALAHTGDARLAALPDVPSLKELGIPVEYNQWTGIFVPKSTPDPIVKKYRDALRAAVNDNSIRAIIGNAGSPIDYLDEPEFQAFWDKDIVKMNEVVRKIGKLD
jgi:tripartite-type tricarboxylate transporter receptor subunit TctC